MQKKSALRGSIEKRQTTMLTYHIYFKKQGYNVGGRNVGKSFAAAGSP